MAFFVIATASTIVTQPLFFLPMLTILTMLGKFLAAAAYPECRFGHILRLIVGEKEFMDKVCLLLLLRLILQMIIFHLRYCDVRE